MLLYGSKLELWQLISLHCQNMYCCSIGVYYYYICILWNILLLFWGINFPSMSDWNLFLCVCFFMGCYSYTKLITPYLMYWMGLLNIFSYELLVYDFYVEILQWLLFVMLIFVFWHLSGCFITTGNVKIIILLILLSVYMHSRCIEFCEMGSINVTLSSI